VLLLERWFIYGAAIISGYIAASGMAGEYVIGKDFERSSRCLIEVLSRH
jgi:hypothetical protein